MVSAWCYYGFLGFWCTSYSVFIGGFAMEMKNDGYIITHTGKKVYPFNMEISDIDILDIAHSLSLQCRYNGHTSQFYSVAEHCVLMSRISEPLLASWALLHDAGEAYLSDICSGVKYKYFQNLVEAEDKLISLIEIKFGLTEYGVIKNNIKKLDKQMYLKEGWDLMPQHPEADWLCEPELNIDLPCWQPVEAKAYFLMRIKELGLKNK